MIRNVGQVTGIRHHPYIEENLHWINAFACLPDALNECRCAADNESLREAQFQNAQQDEKEIDGHCAVDARELHFQSGSEYGNCEIADKAHQIVRLPVREGISQHNHADGRSDADERLGVDR